MQNISDESFIRLIAVMERYLPLGAKFKIAFKAVLFETAYDKGARILSSGQVQQTIWFMLSGLAREIRLDSQTFMEKSSWFWLAGSFLFTSPGFFSHEPSEKTIELLESSELVWISFADWDHLKEQFSEARLMTEKSAPLMKRPGCIIPMNWRIGQLRKGTWRIRERWKIC